MVLGPHPTAQGRARSEMRLAGGPGWEPTIVSIVGVVLFPFFDTREACSLRLVCRELKQAVADFPWEDMGTVIRGSIALWRACFPRAIGANVRRYDPNGGPVRRAPVVDADFVHFVGLRALNMTRCTQVTDAAFVHLRGIERLNMTWCDQATITDAAFEHLKGIHSLVMQWCRQATITGSGLEHLKGICRLGMYHCTDEAIAAAESLGLPVARRPYTRYGAFDTSFVEMEEEEEKEED